jgi:hypothetical protein
LSIEFACSARPRPDSDVDLLVDIEPGRTLLDVIALDQHLEALLGRPAEVLTVGSRRPGPGRNLM